MKAPQSRDAESGGPVAPDTTGRPSLNANQIAQLIRHRDMNAALDRILEADFHTESG